MSEHTVWHIYAVFVKPASLQHHMHVLIVVNELKLDIVERKNTFTQKNYIFLLSISFLPKFYYTNHLIIYSVDNGQHILANTLSSSYVY
jgi:hypothetical protein